MVEKIYSEDFTSKVIKSPNTVLVDFFADWCGPCKMLAPVLDELSTSNTEVDFYKINVDENQDLANAFEISSIPCLILFKAGEEVDRAVGFISKQQLQEFLNKNR
jgi:thioredoxin 1